MSPEERKRLLESSGDAQLMTREERVKIAMDQLGFSRAEAEFHADLLDGKIKDPHIMSQGEWDRRHPHD